MRQLRNPLYDDEDDNLLDGPDDGSDEDAPDDFDMAAIPETSGSDSSSKDDRSDKETPLKSADDDLFDNGDDQGDENYGPGTYQGSLPSAHEPEGGKAQKRFQDVLSEGDSVYGKGKTPGFWRTLAAAGLGGAQGWINSNPKGRPVNYSSQIQEVLYPGRAQKESSYKQRLGLAKTAADEERNSEGAKARNTELAARTEAEKKRAETEAIRAETARAAAAKQKDPHANMVQVSEEYAKNKAQGMVPDVNGQYWIDKSTYNELLKNPNGKYVVTPAGATIVDPTDGHVVYQAPNKPDKGPAGIFPQFFLPAWAGAHGNRTPEQLTDAEKVQAYDEYKTDPKSADLSNALKILDVQMKQLAIGQMPTEQDAIDTATDMVKHRIAPSQLGVIMAAYGAAGQGYKTMVKRALHKLDPEFNLEEAEAEFQLVKSPSFQNTIRYMDSAVNSLPLLLNRAQALKNSNVRFVNGLANMGKDQLNNVQLKQFQVDALLVADEVAKILQGGGTGSGTSDAKLNAAAELIRKSDSSDAVAGALGEINNLISYRRKALTRGTYMENTGPAPTSILMKAPDGTTKSVMAADVEKAKAAGAIPVVQ